MNERISITDEIDSFPPEKRIVELEEKGKALKQLRDIQIEDSKKISNKIKKITIENLANILGMVGVKCQFCVLNLQRTDDDCALINKMLFKLNGGSKCGYVLKPKWLREFNEENFKKEL